MALIKAEELQPGFIIPKLGVVSEIRKLADPELLIILENKTELNSFSWEEFRVADSSIPIHPSHKMESEQDIFECILCNECTCHQLGALAKTCKEL